MLVYYNFGDLSIGRIDKKLAEILRYILCRREIKKSPPETEGKR